MARPRCASERTGSTGLLCVVNICEGRNPGIIDAIAAAGGRSVLDLHSDEDHHRTVVTMGGGDLEEAVRAVAGQAVELIDLRRHRGVHPRLGAVDVVPFVPLDGDGSPVSGAADLTDAIAARDRFAGWAGRFLDLPCFLYGPERTLPTVRREAFHQRAPDTGPDRPHPTAGACAVGARPALVAYNLWLTTADRSVATAIAAAVRGPAVRALGLATAGTTQVSCNLVDPAAVGPAQVYDAVDRSARAAGTTIERAELVGLVPAAVVKGTPRGRWKELDLDSERTVEARLERAGRG